MKTKLILALFILINNFLNIYAQTGVAINISGTPADASAILDVSSTNAGLLIPRVTTVERDLINSPAQGLQIYNLSTNCFEFYEFGYWHKFKCAYNCGVSTVTFSYRNKIETYGTVRGANSTCWLDRNIGANAVATAINDTNSYGHLFQWGRGADGHQLRNSLVTNVLSNSDIPNHSNYIAVWSQPRDWRTPQNNSLWQGAYGMNNPCPSGWRVPTAAEFVDEITSWSQQNSNGAFLSNQKFTIAGNRVFSSGEFSGVGVSGAYWSSTVNLLQAEFMELSNVSAQIFATRRANAYSIRCIKD